MIDVNQMLWPCTCACMHARVFGCVIGTSVNMVDDNVSAVTLATVLSGLRHNPCRPSFGGLDKG